MEKIYGLYGFSLCLSVFRGWMDSQLDGAMVRGWEGGKEIIWGRGGGDQTQKIPPLEKRRWEGG